MLSPLQPFTNKKAGILSLSAFFCFLPFGVIVAIASSKSSLVSRKWG